MNKKKICIIGIIFLVLEQILKIKLINKEIIVIPKLLNICYTKNKGIAFSIFENSSKLIIILNIFIILLIIKYIKDNIKKVRNKEFIFYLFILVGGISNLIDRIFRGYVIDYIKVNIFNFPIFNIEDVLIFTGIIFLTMINIFKIIDKEKR